MGQGRLGCIAVEECGQLLLLHLLRVCTLRLHLRGGGNHASCTTAAHAACLAPTLRCMGGCMRGVALCLPVCMLLLVLCSQGSAHCIRQHGCIIAIPSHATNNACSTCMGPIRQACKLTAMTMTVLVVLDTSRVFREPQRRMLRFIGLSFSA